MDLERLTAKLLAKFRPLHEVATDRVKNMDTLGRESGGSKSFDRAEKNRQLI